MNKLLITKKKGMTSLITDDGVVTGVTILELIESEVVEDRTIDKNGYTAKVIGYQKSSNLIKPKKGFFDKVSKQYYKRTIECRDCVQKDLSVDLFSENEQVVLRSKSKGRGFSGTIKRHNFRRGPKTHGSKSYRIPGSIGQCSTPSKVMKGKRMAGQYGNKFVSHKTIVLKIDQENNLLFVKGGVAGANNSTIFVQGKES